MQCIERGRTKARSCGHENSGYQHPIESVKPSTVRTGRIAGTGVYFGRPSGGVAAAIAAIAFEMDQTPRISRSTARAILWLLILIGCVRIAGTYAFLNQTYDEPLHVACGMEWWSKGTYNYGHLHPPLPQVLMAAGPYFDGLRSQSRETFWAEGDALLYANNHYWRTLTLARIGNLPFFILGCLVVYAWGCRWFSRTTGLVAVFLFSTLPPILGHAGLATNDVPCCAAVALGLFCVMAWVEDPSWKRTAALSGALAFAVLCKFSAIGYIAGCGLVIVAVSWRTLRERPVWRAKQLVAVLFAAAVLVWGGYRFSLQRLDTLPQFQRLVETKPALAAIGHTPLPFTEMFLSLVKLAHQNQLIHDSYLLGQYGVHWWYFFPVVLAVKAPLGLLILAIVAAVTAGRWMSYSDHPWRLATLLFPAVILAIAMSSRIDLGVRHLLPIFPYLAILAAQGAVWLCRAPRVGWRVALVIALVGFDAVHSAAAGIDQLAYFNPLAGSHPERILCESDLDWGQDLNRLSVRLRELGVPRVSIAYFGTARVEAAGLPPYRTIGGQEKVGGWVAASIRYLTLLRAKDGSFSWLRDIEPTEKIGRSIYLFHLPD